MWLRIPVSPRRLGGLRETAFSHGVFTEMLNRFDRLPRTEFPLDDEQHEELTRRVKIWRAAARELTPFDERSREIGKGRTPDLGIDL